MYWARSGSPGIRTVVGEVARSGVDVLGGHGAARGASDSAHRSWTVCRLRAPQRLRGPRVAFCDSAGLAMPIIAASIVARSPRATSQTRHTGRRILARATRSSFAPVAHASRGPLLQSPHWRACTGRRYAQDRQLEEIIVTAHRRAENVQEVPLSVPPLSGEQLDTLFEGGDDIRALATRVPACTPSRRTDGSRRASTSAASATPTSTWPLRSPCRSSSTTSCSRTSSSRASRCSTSNRVEVLRGPQGSLFGRNTPAGIVKFDTETDRQTSTRR